MTADLEARINDSLNNKGSRRSFMKFLGRLTAASYVSTKACIKSCSKAILYGGTFTAGTVAGLTQHLKQMAADLPLYQDNGLAVLVSYGTSDEELVYNTETKELNFGHQPIIIKNPFTGQYVSYSNPHEIDLLFTDTELKEVGKLFLGAYQSRIELALQQKANLFIEGATKQDLYNVLHDPHLQSVVVLGHGYWSGWQATDEFITTIMLEENSWEQKRGYFLRHTCGSSSSEPVKVFHLHDHDKKEISSYFKFLNQDNGSPLQLSSLYFDNVRGDYYSDITFNLTIPSYYFGPLQGNLTNFPLSSRVICALGKGNDSLKKFSLAELFGSEKEPEKSPPAYEEKVKGFQQLHENLSLRQDALELFNNLRYFLGKYILQTDWEFGTQVFPQENIFGWKRVAYPWDYFRDPFAGKNPSPPSYNFLPCTR